MCREYFCNVGLKLERCQKCKTWMSWFLGFCDEQGVTMATMEGSGAVVFGKDVQSGTSGSQIGMHALVISGSIVLS
jgi:hypothetical protein